MANPKKTIEDGSVLTLAEVTSGDLISPKGNNLTFSQVGSTLVYTASASLGDGRSEFYRIDFGDRSGVMSRKVQ
jgi:hypothetical protein